MIEIDKVQDGDTIVWMGKCGEVFGKVRRDANGTLVAFTDELHSLPVDLLCRCYGTRLIKGDGMRTTAEATPAHVFHTIDDAPVLF